MQGMGMPISIDAATIAAIAAAVAIFFAVVMLIMAMLRGERTRAEELARVVRLGELTDRLAEGQAALSGRVEQAHGVLGERLEALAARVGEGLHGVGDRTFEALRAMHERLAVLDVAQRTIADLTGQVADLQALMSNKQARGAFGEVQLYDLVASMLPPSAYDFQVTLSQRQAGRLPVAPAQAARPDRHRRQVPAGELSAPCCEARDERGAASGRPRLPAGRAEHIHDIADKYIVAGETADSALMFLPSEAIYAELHANFRNVVEEFFRRKVWIVSPTTLWATLNTVRAVLKDVRLREQAQRIQAELQALGDDLRRLDERAHNLQRHFEQAGDDLRQLRLSAAKVATRAAGIDLTTLQAADPALPAAAAGSDDDK